MGSIAATASDRVFIRTAGAAPRPLQLSTQSRDITSGIAPGRGKGLHNVPACAAFHHQMGEHGGS